jgi:hypothetical protein
MVTTHKEVRLSNCRKALLKKKSSSSYGKRKRLEKSFGLEKKTGSKNIATQKKEQKHSKAPVMKRGMITKKFWLRKKTRSKT